MNSHFNFSFLYSLALSTLCASVRVAEAIGRNAMLSLFYPKTSGNDPVPEKYAKGASPAARLLLTLRGDAPLITVFRLLYWVAMSFWLNPGANPKLYHKSSIALNVCLSKVRHQALALTD
jgi:hypothetical protein